jgi:hypothetical protein
MQKLHYTNDLQASLENFKIEIQESNQPFFLTYWNTINAIGKGGIKFMELVKQEFPEQFKKIN